MLTFFVLISFFGGMYLLTAESYDTRSIIMLVSMVGVYLAVFTPWRVFVRRPPPRRPRPPLYGMVALHDAHSAHYTHSHRYARASTSPRATAVNSILSRLVELEPKRFLQIIISPASRVSNTHSLAAMHFDFSHVSYCKLYDTSLQLFWNIITV